MKPFSLIKVVFVTCSFAFGLTIAGQINAQGSDWEPPMPRMKSSGGEISVERGAEVFQSHCVNCHGIRGKGEGFKKYSWDEDQVVPDLTDADYMEARRDEIARSLNDGRRLVEPPLIVMPAFRYVLSANDQKSVLAYLKTLEQ